MDSMRSTLTTSEFLRVKEHVLSNGITVWLNEDHSQPKIIGTVLVKAGSSDAPNTGIAHFLEHMMFKGTDKIGTTDYKSEKVLLDLISDKYDALAQTRDPEVRARLQKIINDLSVEAAEYVIPNEFNRLITHYGGTDLNARTTQDCTFFFNTFSPQYVAQWSEINSERLINPVFRLFQSELDTVFEEKNTFNNTFGGRAYSRVMERYYYPHPYAFSGVGSVDNLRNLSVSDIRRFYEKYYVASNMGLLLSGDFDTDQVLPILESTFSRIRRGNAPKREFEQPPKFSGREKMAINLEIPFMKGMGLGFRGLRADSIDQLPLKIASMLLNNSNGTGFLDKLVLDHKLLTAMVINDNYRDGGMLAVVMMPKMFFQSYSSVEKMWWKVIDRIKNGDFSDSFFDSVKLELKRDTLFNLEDINSRMPTMIDVFIQDRSWQDYINYVSDIDQITKQDVIDVVNRYFTKDYLLVTKKTGTYPVNIIAKSGFDPIIPKHSDASSDYFNNMKKKPVEELKPHFIDFDKDMEFTQISPMANLYSKANPVNDIFTIVVSYGVGSISMRNLDKLELYLSMLGTESMTFDTFWSRLQELGATLDFDSTETTFNVVMNGFDGKFAEAMKLLGDFLRNVKVDNKKLRQVVAEEKVIEKSLFESSDSMSGLMLEKMKYGKASRYLTKMTLKELKRLKGKNFIEMFDWVKEHECNIHYCGNLPKDKVIEIIREEVPLDKLSKPCNIESREMMVYDKPTIFFYDMKNISQSVVHAYIHIDKLRDERERHLGFLFNEYLGGDMSSILFQEIREFRSIAYDVSSSLKYSRRMRPNEPAGLVMRLATQSEDTVDAINVLEGIVRDMPERPERINIVKQNIRNMANNEYPTFRSMTMKVAGYRFLGFDCDPNKSRLESINSMDIDDVMGFYREKIKNNVINYSIVGNSKLIDMNRLAEFGEIVKLSKKDIYK